MIIGCDRSQGRNPRCINLYIKSSCSIVECITANGGAVKAHQNQIDLQYVVLNSVHEYKSLSAVNSSR